MADQHKNGAERAGDRREKFGYHVSLRGELLYSWSIGADTHRMHIATIQEATTSKHRLPAAVML